MKEVFIAGISAVTGLGNSLDESWEGVFCGKTAIKDIKHFDTQRIEFKKAGCIDYLWDGCYENRVLELAIKSCDGIEEIPLDSTLIWAGIKGNSEYLESDKGNKYYLPAHYSKAIAERYKLKSERIEVNAACASSTIGIAYAAGKIAFGEAGSVLVCASDIVSRFVHMGFSALQALSPTICRPFDRDRDGLNLGDGAAAVLLADKETIDRYNLNKISRVAGWGISNDANHITGPARDGCGLILSIEKAMKMASMLPDNIQAFCAHGTGTPYNDGMELTAIESVFGKRKFPVFSIKGAIGHTLGAAGAIEAGFSSLAMQKKIVPPTVGLRNLEERAEGRFSDKPQKFGGNNILTTNSGFGGVNAALILENALETVNK